ncbi:CU044_5270 family protein [Streptomyces sp. E11-3]|uniref:CU044_5270 family protein n=1 Tax=Streptomyces sp. E11-3 TaxID=3110112 RepID=UPI00397F98FD
MTDELELLRDWDADATPLTEPARAQARHRLLNTIAHAERHPGAALSRRRALRLATAAVVATAVTGTAVLITADESANAPRMVNARAAKVLNAAAAWESKHEKPVEPRDDQFIYWKRIITETDDTGKVKTFVDEMWNSVDGSKRSLTMERGNVFWEEPLKKGHGVWPPQKWSLLEKLPTDPEKLLLVMTGDRTPPESISDLGDDRWWSLAFTLTALLKHPVLPEGLRPAAYEALALIPDMKAVPGMKDARGRTGVGIAYTKSPPGEPKQKPGQEQYAIFDARTYEYLGFRDTCDAGKECVQRSYVADWAIVDRLKQRP